MKINARNGNHLHFWCHALALRWQTFFYFFLFFCFSIISREDTFVGHSGIINIKQLWIFYTQRSSSRDPWSLRCLNDYTQYSTTELSAQGRGNTAWHNRLFPLNLCFHLKLHFTGKGSFIALRIKYLFHCNFFWGKRVFSQCTRREDLQLLNTDQNQANPPKIRSTEFIPQSRRRQRGKQESLTQFCGSSPQSGN